ncbi:MAG: PAS domain-containing protein [Planctomycetes bacterium]|nr:PAS domain-containing protein [Planctomycetota bacterium]
MNPWYSSGRGVQKASAPPHAHDVAGATNAEASVPSASNLLATLLNFSHDGILAFNREFRYTAWNHAMERISGLSREAVLGKRVFEIFPVLREIPPDRAMAELSEGRSLVSRNCPYHVRQSGRKGFFDATVHPLEDDHGVVTGGMAIIRDTTSACARRIFNAKASPDSGSWRTALRY